MISNKGDIYYLLTNEDNERQYLMETCEYNEDIHHSLQDEGTHLMDTISIHYKSFTKQ